MIDWLYVLLGLVVAGAIFARTRAGDRLRRRLPFRSLQKDRAPREDRDYLLRVSGNDPARVERLLDHERSGNPELSEAQAYRRAIRRHLRDQR